MYSSNWKRLNLIICRQIYENWGGLITDQIHIRCGGPVDLQAEILATCYQDYFTTGRILLNVFLSERQFRYMDMSDMRDIFRSDSQSVIVPGTPGRR